MRSIIHYLLKSYLFIALCAAASVGSGWILMGQKLAKLPINCPLIAFNATFIMYNFSLLVLQVLKGSGSSGRRLWFGAHNTSLYILLLASSGALLLSLFYTSLNSILFLVHLGIISLLYNMPPTVVASAYISVRKLPLLKIFLIAYVWSAVSVGLPWIESEIAWPTALFAFLTQYIFILAITIPFDIRDYRLDQQVSLLTLPQWLGINRARILSIMLLLVYCLLQGLTFSHYVTSAFLFGLGSLLMYKAGPTRPYWYYLGLVDGLLILQFIVLYTTL